MQTIIAQPDAPAGAPILAYEPESGLIVEADFTLPMLPGCRPEWHTDPAYQATWPHEGDPFYEPWDR